MKPDKTPPTSPLPILPPAIRVDVYHHFPEGIPDTTAFDAVLRLQIQHLKHARVALKAAVHANQLTRSKGE